MLRGVAIAPESVWLLGPREDLADRGYHALLPNMAQPPVSGSRCTRTTTMRAYWTKLHDAQRKRADEDARHRWAQDRTGGIWWMLGSDANGGPSGSERRVGRLETNRGSMDRVNCTIPLLDSEIEVLSGIGRETWIKAKALVSFRLLPTPRVLAEVFDAPITLAGNLYNTGRLSTIRLPGGPAVEVRTLEVRLNDSDSSLVMPSRQPVTSIRTGAKVLSVRFDILNFPSLFQHDRSAVLQQGPWRIEIRPHENLDATKKVLKTHSGYGLTHEGIMRRLDHKPFTVEKAESILRTLHHFLSFARGGSCGLALIVGMDERGDKAWEQWGAYSTYPWFSLSSWLDHRHNNDRELAEAFAGFMRMMKAASYSYDERIPAALYWYLRGNESNNPYSAIILAHAALERLSREIVSDVERSADGKSAKLGVALKKAGIDPTLPASCKRLSGVSKRDGPKVLADTRNNLIHSEVHEVLTQEELIRVQDLGQWYVELLLLRKCGYRGRYANRLKYIYEGRWEREAVPWATGA